MTRSEARESAFILIFEKIFNPEYSLEDMRSLADDSDVININGFTEQLFSKADENLNSIDEEIKKYLKNWRIERLPKTALAILRLAFTEIMFFDEIPSGATVNEAVELAKKYAGEKDASFINGVLGNYLRNGKSE
ncbi:MAG: transcription antitermination factor NusB [Oscillospiraceae bacterium]|nr:transcription antitermination factor NusB [Oscillospiraceae bacterium]